MFVFSDNTAYVLPLGLPWKLMHQLYGG